MHDSSLNPFLDAYCMPHRHLLAWRPKGPGLYAIYGNDQIYVGETGNLADRLRSSLRERKFGETIICFPLRSPGALSEKPQRADLESDCISALQTYLWGYDMPLCLTNSLHVALLESIAWRADCPAHLTLAITTARTILDALGIPHAWSGLPDQRTLLKSGRRSVKADVAGLWPIILNAAKYTREERYRQAVKLTGSARYSLSGVFDQLRAQDFVARLACAAGKRASGHFGTGLIA